MNDGELRAFRVDVLRRCGAQDDVIPDLLEYNHCPFAKPLETELAEFPLADEAFASVWEQYERESRDAGAWEVLRERLIQLRFPIRAGISANEDYRRATRKGKFDAAEGFAPGLILNHPQDLELVIYPTIAGRIAVIWVSDREDFTSLVRSLSARNEPEPVPDTMGACIVTGLNNWDRIAAYRRRWESAQPGLVTEQAWNEEFRRIVPQKKLYQDRFIILSRGPYSAVAADDVGMSEQEWVSRSLVIRREHEFTHYFTLRVFGVMRNNAFDELLADFLGLIRTFESYQGDLARRFLGLEDHPHYREGGRLENYRGDPPLSDDAFLVLQRLVADAIGNLELTAAENSHLLASLQGLARLIHGLANLTLEELASGDMRVRLAQWL